MKIVEASNLLKKAHSLLYPVFGEKARLLPYFVDESVMEPTYKDNALLLPIEANTSLSEAIYSLKLASVMYENQMNTEMIPSFITDLVQDVTNAVLMSLREEKNDNTVTVSLEDSSTAKAISLPYKTVDVLDNTVNFMIFSKHVQIETSRGVLFKERDPLIEIKKKAGKSSASLQRTIYTVRIPKALLEEAFLFEGDYQYMPFSTNDEDEE